MANTTQSSTVIEHTTRCDKERERVTTQFFHQGKKVKVNTYTYKAELII